jgi:diguanylate cyclase (GGDEF)-like protein
MNLQAIPAARAQAWCALATLLSLTAYTLWPDSRGAALQLLCLIPIGAMLVMGPHDLLLVCAVSLGLLIITLVALAILPLEGIQFDWTHDGIDAMMVCLILPLLGYFAYRYSQRRQAMVEQRQALNDTLGAMQAMSARDALTGLLNQQHMSASLHQEFKRAQRANAPMSLALIDPDHLRAYNEQHGHDAGDQWLTRFAQMLPLTLRENEVVARWEGATFMVIFTDTPLEQASIGMSRLRQQIGASELGQGFSAGLVSRRETDSLDDMLARVQQALQQAKGDGRDRTTALR